MYMIINALQDCCEDWMNENIGSTYIEYEFPWWLSSKESACNAGDTGDARSNPGSERSSGEGNSNPLQHSCLENSMDRGGWRAILRGISKSWTQLSI